METKTVGIGEIRVFEGMPPGNNPWRDGALCGDKRKDAILSLTAHKHCLACYSYWVCQNGFCRRIDNDDVISTTVSTVTIRL